MNNDASIFCLPPNRIVAPWLKSSGNEELLDSCVQYILSPPPDFRACLIEASGGAGLTSLLNATKTRLRREKINAVAIDDGLGGDDPYILTALLEAMKVPLPLKSRKCLTAVAERVLQLRRLDCIMVYDVQRFCYLDRAQKNINLDALRYLGRLLPNCKFILGGYPEAVSNFGDAFKADCARILTIKPMPFDQRYNDFVRDVLCLVGAQQLINKLDFKVVHAMSHGFVGITFSELQYTAIKAANAGYLMSVEYGSVLEL